MDAAPHRDLGPSGRAGKLGRCRPRPSPGQATGQPHRAAQCLVRRARAAADEQEAELRHARPDTRAVAGHGAELHHQARAPAGRPDAGAAADRARRIRRGAGRTSCSCTGRRSPNRGMRPRSAGRRGPGRPGVWCGRWPSSPRCGRRCTPRSAAATRSPTTGRTETGRCRRMCRAPTTRGCAATSSRPPPVNCGR